MAQSMVRLARRPLQAAKRKAIGRLGLISDQKFYLDSGITRQRTDVERIQLHSDAIDVGKCYLRTYAPKRGRISPALWRSRPVWQRPLPA